MMRPRCIAFVGSGGATKGVAHLGVLKAMEQLRIKAQVYVGASAGAVAGAFASQGFSVDEALDWLRPFWRRKSSAAMKGRYFFGLPTWEQVTKPGYLMSGLLSIDRYERFLAKRLPTNDFRQLGQSFLVTAADIDGLGRAVFGPGYRDDVPISQAVAASCCVPLLYRPYRIGERYYIDGEVVRTLSLDLAIEAGANVVIVSNVYRPHTTRRKETPLALRGGSAVLRQTLNIVLSEKEKRGIDLIHRLYPHVTVLNIAADLGRFSFTGRRHTGHLVTRAYREALRVLRAAQQRGVFG